MNPCLWLQECDINIENLSIICTKLYTKILLSKQGLLCVCDIYSGKNCFSLQFTQISTYLKLSLRSAAWSISIPIHPHDYSSKSQISAFAQQIFTGQYPPQQWIHLYHLVEYDTNLRSDYNLELTAFQIPKVSFLFLSILLLFIHVFPQAL